uniref:RE59052p n=2 Tax=Drosophila melanogaster TaxID=7227 RepID=Q8IGN3_DROME|nr:RE59052p [Drosophila melanogaster]
MFLAVNQSLQNTSKKKRKRRTAEDDPQEDSGEGTPPVRPLEPSASSDQLVGVGNGATCRVCKCPGRQSLTLVYIYLGALTLILASLSIVFYTHTQDVESLSQVEDNYSSKSFRVQFQAELMRSEEELRRLVNRIIEEEQELVGSTTASSTTQSRDPLKNERKFTDNLISHTTRPTGKRMRRDIASSAPASMHADPLIEFFNPNHRKVLEEQDTEIRKRTGQKGAAPGGDEWIYLNTYCRVPEKIITGFCKGTQDYCPPAPQGPTGEVGPKGPPGNPGLPGIPGPKGNRGDVGLPGAPGVDGVGHLGPAGPRGPKGDAGATGRAGLDGRDGVPGEPGLDGVPGRAGADGKNGLPGRDGKDGLHGKDGKDGLSITGPKGAQGPPGERGLKGIAGPRGRPGKPGTNGIPGVPGINAWKLQYPNGSSSNDLLIPPSITDIQVPDFQRTVIVEEGRSLNLSCTATGTPTPQVEWRREDGRTVNVNGVEMASISGQFLRFTNITRHQMAAYTCFANNGIAPVANATYLVEVQFAPMISVYRQMIYAEYQSSATLECLVEAFPEAIRYWERAYDGKILDPSDKYGIESYPEGFKTTMRLTISNLRKDDFGYYHCVARNELNATMVNFEIAPQDPNSETPYVGNNMKVYGQRPPESECPVCDQCPDPSLYQCKDSILNNFEIQATGNLSYPGLPKRPKTCYLYAVGKPVFHKVVNEKFGSWLRDPSPDSDREKTFVTNENDPYNLFEFTTRIQYRMNSIPRRKYEIQEGFHGNAHVVFNGSFYYQQRNSDLVVKLDLTSLKKITTQLPYAGVAAANRLYTTDYNYMDFNVDEVGLWVIYSTYNSNNTLVAKLDAETLKMQYNFNITLDHHQFGAMFIVCGNLYAIDSGTDKNTQIRYVVDLYKGKLLNTNLPFSNPFSHTTTVGYNPLTVELYSWDKGNALTYPIRYNEQRLISDNS